MTLNSMTGFARTDGKDSAVGWFWEVKTLNGRGLDVRLRMPPGYEALDQPIREACAKRLTRGTCSISLNVKRESFSSELQLNEAALCQVVVAAKKLEGIVEASPATIDGLLALRGVLELVEPEEDEETQAKRRDAIMQGFHQTLDILVKARRAEGARLEQAIKAQIDTIGELGSRAEKCEARTPDNIKIRLKEQISRLLDTEAQFNEDRLYQEAALIAAKADIAEEIERLKAHVEASNSAAASTWAFSLSISSAISAFAAIKAASWYRRSSLN